MNKNTTYLLLLLLIVIVTFSHLNIPTAFETGGGSCYQGITATIIQFFLKVCGVLSLLSLLAVSFTRMIKAAKMLSVVSLGIWTMGTIIHSIDALLTAVVYFAPLLVLNILIVVLIFKGGSAGKESESVSVIK